MTRRNLVGEIAFLIFACGFLAGLVAGILLRDLLFPSLTPVASAPSKVMASSIEKQPNLVPEVQVRRANQDI